MEDSIFIKVLEYGEQVGIDGTTDADFWKWAKNLGVDNKSGNIQESLKTNALQSILKECFDRAYATEDNGSKTEHYYKLVLKTEYYFRLIEYRELQESRAAARSANKNAMWAIGISVAAIIVSAVLTFTQLNTPATINKSDLNALIKSNKEAGVQRKVKLDSLQMAQILTAIGDNQSNTKAKKVKATDQGQEVSHYELINQYFEDE